MFATIKQIFNPKNKDLQKRILFTLAALFVFKIGTAIITATSSNGKTATSRINVVNSKNLLVN